MQTPARTRNVFAFLYGVYLCTAFLQFSFILSILGFILLTLAAAAVYALRRRVAGSFLESHATWLIRTYWLGAGLYLPLVTLIGAAVMLSVLDINALADQVMQGGIANEQDMMDALLNHGGGIVQKTSLGMGVVLGGWWGYRCLRGILALHNTTDIPNPKSWV